MVNALIIISMFIGQFSTLLFHDLFTFEQKKGMADTIHQDLNGHLHMKFQCNSFSSIEIIDLTKIHVLKKTPMMASWS
jgi:hypothetical protein